MQLSHHHLLGCSGPTVLHTYITAILFSEKSCWGFKIRITLNPWVIFERISIFRVESFYPEQDICLGFPEYHSVNVIIFTTKISNISIISR
jgi:hypothetical protein